MSQRHLVSFSRWLLVIPGALLLTAAECGGDDAGVAGDGAVADHEHNSCGLMKNCTNSLTFTHGLMVDGKMGKFSATIMHGDEPSVMDSSWMVTIQDADGADVTDATVTVQSWSEDCMHDGPTPPKDVTANDMGMYMVEPVFAHGGPWETRLMLDRDGETDMIHIPFCIPGESHVGGAADAGEPSGHEGH